MGEDIGESHLQGCPGADSCTHAQFCLQYASLSSANFVLIYFQLLAKFYES